LAEGLARVRGVAGVRGMGLLLAAQLAEPGTARHVAARALLAGLVVNPVTDSALRFEPSLLVTDAEIDEAVAILASVLT
ncbi:MAG: aminotransferase class III-fold pyridoxal phosphate-dependent enzyme, partial [Actinomycetota bacterium]|nr:aminotransferase class III-fold pyridoxal phosphate-dependent enzyme [Actinomycetota bacterium]